MFEIDEGTPAQSGFRMPAEWDVHAGCLMSWPVRHELWGTRLDEAKRDFATMARAVAGFEPLTMACPPGSEREVRDLCGSDVTVLPTPLDDSWARDNGPIFVRDVAGRLAVVDFRFNAWGERWHPYDSDDALPERVAEHLDLPLFKAPMVLEGGSFYVDGEGTLLTTEQCLLNPNRNPSLSREQIEQILRDYLGVSTIVWLPFGQTLDVGPEATDGHVDGIAQYLGPAHVLLEAPASAQASEHETGAANLTILQSATDATGRRFDVEVLDAGPGDSRGYCNFYLANGGVVVPVSGHPGDDEILDQLGALFPGREVVGVPGEVIAFGGGGPHCVTQQIPAAKPSDA